MGLVKDCADNVNWIRKYGYIKEFGINAEEVKSEILFLSGERVSLSFDI